MAKVKLKSPENRTKPAFTLPTPADIVGVLRNGCIATSKIRLPQPGKPAKKMTQGRIRSLLREAAKRKTTEQRRHEIKTILLGEIRAEKSGDARKAGMLFIIEKVFDSALANRRGYLPKLFPVFALVCGPKQKNLLTAESTGRSFSEKLTIVPTRRLILHGFFIDFYY